MTIVEFRENLKKTPRPDVMAKEIVIQDSDTLVELVKNQMQHGNRGGVRKDVARLGWYKPRSKVDEEDGPSAYALMKHEMNPLPGLGIVDLKLTGAFYNAFYFDREALEVTSSDSKTETLKERFGKLLFKYTPDSVRQFSHTFNDKFFAYYRAFFADENLL